MQLWLTGPSGLPVCVCRQQGTGPTQWDNFVERVKGMAAADGMDMKELPARVNEVRGPHPDQQALRYSRSFCRWLAAELAVALDIARHSSSYRIDLSSPFSDSATLSRSKLPMKMYHAPGMVTAPLLLLPLIMQFHFLPHEPLHKYKEELLLWASCRGQLLARTVRGMMTYRTALAALADFENPRVTASAAAAAAQRHSSAGGSSSSSNSSSSIPEPDALRTAILQDLVDKKFSYIVSSQNLGEFGTQVASDLKAAWLVHAIRTLMHRHTALKVAFIDKHPLVVASRPPGMKVEIRRDCSVLLCSVRQQQLMRALGMHVAADEPQREAYRWVLGIK